MPNTITPTIAHAPTSFSTPSSGVDSHKRFNADGACSIYMQHGYLGEERCRYRHDPAGLIASVADSTGKNRHGLASSGIPKAADGNICRSQPLGSKWSA